MRPHARQAAEEGRQGYEPPLPAIAATGRAPGCSVRASRDASARPARGRMRGRLRRRAGWDYEPPLPSTAAACRAAAGAWRQREGFTGCQRSPHTRPHARHAAEEGRQGYEPPLPAIAAAGRAPGGSVRASRAASARPACGRMRGRLRRRAGRAYEPPLPATADAGRAPVSSVRASRAASARRARGRMRGRLRRRAGRAMNPLFRPSLPSAERLAAA